MQSRTAKLNMLTSPVKTGHKLSSISRCMQQSACTQFTLPINHAVSCLKHHVDCYALSSMSCRCLSVSIWCQDSSERICLNSQPQLKQTHFQHTQLTQMLATVQVTLQLLSNRALTCARSLLSVCCALAQNLRHSKVLTSRMHMFATQLQCHAGVVGMQT